MDPLFTIDDGVGLEKPPVGELGPGEVLGAPVPAPDATASVALGLEAAEAGLELVCPNCGCKDPAVAQADAASVATCPQCQCEFECPGQQQPAVEMGAFPMESGTQRILGRIFERHVRRQQHALKRTVGQVTQPKLPHAP